MCLKVVWYRACPGRSLLLPNFCPPVTVPAAVADAGATGNSHANSAAVADGDVGNNKTKGADDKGGEEDRGEEDEGTATGGSSGMGEKSVLQAKLTKLAIQIGYTGELYVLV